MTLRRRAFLAGSAFAALLATAPRALGYPRSVQGPMVGAPGPDFFTVWVPAARRRTLLATNG